MTTEELSVLFSTLNRTIKISTDETLTLENISAFNEFLKNEREFWQPLAQGLPEICQQISQSLNFLQQAMNGANDSQLLAQAIGSLNRSGFISSSTLKGKFLKELYDRSPDSAASAYLYLTNQQIPAHLYLNSRCVDGIIAASLFAHPEAISLKLGAEVTRFSEVREGLMADRQQLASDSRVLIAEAKESHLSVQSKFDAMFTQNRAAFQVQYDAQAGEAEQAHARLESITQDAQSSIEALRALYNEKLRLQEPASYWCQLETKYVRQGFLGIFASLGSVIGLALATREFVYNPPALLNSDKFTLSGFKGAVVIAGGLSMAIYFINLLAKLTTSAFHLARDARERYQLTHVYLALKKEGAVTEDDRKIILSALFSRSDTGLLKHDASPELSIPGLIAAIKGK